MIKLLFSEDQKKINAHKISLSIFSLLAGLQMIMISCSKKEAIIVKKSSNPEKFETVTKVKQIEDEDPPAEYVKRLIKESEYIALVKRTKVDSVYLADKINHVTILKSYKGNLKKDREVSYFVMSDMPYNKNTNDTLLIFLNKNKEPFTGLKGKKITFAAPDNSGFKYTKFIDSLLVK